MTPLAWAAVLAALALLPPAVGLFRAARARRPGAFLLRLGTLVPIVALLAGLSVLLLGTVGYNALTRETVAAVVTVRPVGEQTFDARFEVPGREMVTYRLKGDELYVDARILKWKYFANLLGLHTLYELDRVAGRYRDLEDERTRERTVHSLSGQRVVDLFDLRRRYSGLAPLFDTEYGSATFVPADRPVVLELRVSTTGLLMRLKPAGSIAD